MKSGHGGCQSGNLESGMKYTVKKTMTAASCAVFVMFVLEDFHSEVCFIVKQIALIVY